ncbi:stimulated by retinoic acid gene 6 protein homolog [Elysia marginata]|uniref:Stimulated by retinoic acid gene 6 protein homolog n=1 Tax=Elysia marginata TaxID=1093978 RepID=A0AAV4I632_9GAST|nr:stimulated by retinoic acid gene 6 protein homolog [Elysia marginata]
MSCYNLLYTVLCHRQSRYIPPPPPPCRPGFRYPSQLVSVLFVAACVVYMLTVELLFMFVDTFDRIQEGINKDIGPLGWHKKPGEDPHITSARDQYFEAKHWVFMVESKIRSNLFAMYRGDFKIIPPITEKKPVWLCAGSIKYAGFQVAYIVWAYIVLWVVLFAFLFFFAVVCDGHLNFVVEDVVQFWPGVVVAIVLLIILMVLAKYVFLQDKGENLRLDNRHSYFIFAYFMFFYNIFLGLVSCLMRILKAIAIGSFFLARLDSSTLPRKFEYLDPGVCEDACADVSTALGRPVDGEVTDEPTEKSLQDLLCCTRPIASNYGETPVIQRKKIFREIQRLKQHTAEISSVLENGSGSVHRLHAPRGSSHAPCSECLSQTARLPQSQEKATPATHGRRDTRHGQHWD